MSYQLSSEIISKIKALPNFRADMKPKTVPTVKKMYGISGDERIIAYCGFTKRLFSKIENGGVVFTDKGVYRSLPRWTLDDTHDTYSVKYEDMPECIPVINYYKSESEADYQAQLMKCFRDGSFDCLSFWVSVYSDEEVSKAVTEIFIDIIKEMISQNENYKERNEHTKQAYINDTLNDYKKRKSCNTWVLRQQIERGDLNAEQLAKALYLCFCQNILYGNAEDIQAAYEYVEQHSDLLDNRQFTEAIDPAIKEAIDNLRTPQSNKDADKLYALCVKNNEYAVDVFPDLARYYFNKGVYYQENDYSYVDRFITAFKDTSYIDTLQEILEACIEESLPVRLSDWKENPSSKADEDFVIYVMSKNVSYATAASGLIEHYCSIDEFDEARHRLVLIKESGCYDDLTRGLERCIDESSAVYASKKYALGMECLEAENINEALQYFDEAIRYDNHNQEYPLTLISTELDRKRYREAKLDIEKILRHKPDFDSDNEQKFKDMEITCLEEISQEMGAFYDLIRKNNGNFIDTKPETLALKDQFGLSFYHYAILLHKYYIVTGVDVRKTEAEKNVCGYELMTFGCGQGVIPNTFLGLLMEYDKDVKRLRRNYKLKRGVNTAKKAASAIVNSIASEYIDAANNSASEIDTYISDMDEQTAYMDKNANQYKENMEKLESERDKRLNYGTSMENLQDSLSSSIQTDDEMEKNFLIQLRDLMREKFTMYETKLKESINFSDIESKMIYLIISNPEWLKTIFHGDKKDFKIYEDAGRFWYLPKAFILQAQQLTADDLPDPVVFEVSQIDEPEEDFSDEYDENFDDDDLYYDTF